MTDPAQLAITLRDAGFSPRAVIIDDGSTQINPLQGALRLGFDAGWVLSVDDYGMTEQLARFDTFDDAAESLLAYLSGPAPAVEQLDEGGLAAALEAQSSALAGLPDALRAGNAPLLVDLPAGTLLDHLGAPDGLLLYLPDSLFIERSLPLDAFDVERTDSGRYYYRTQQPLKVQAALAPPYFGQPGGALYFRVMPGSTIRRLLASGALGRVDVAQ
jgi:hypothetical protein